MLVINCIHELNQCHRFCVHNRQNGNRKSNVIFLLAEYGFIKVFRLLFLPEQFEAADADTCWCGKAACTNPAIMVPVPAAQGICE